MPDLNEFKRIQVEVEYFFVIIINLSSHFLIDFKSPQQFSLENKTNGIPDEKFTHRPPKPRPPTIKGFMVP